MSQENLDEIPPFGVYEGERNQIKLRHGQGKNTFPNGDIYEGTYDNGKRSGQGKYTFKSGAVYIGEYQNGERTGTASMTYPDKSKYEGQFLKGKRHGTGTYTYANGDVYSGQWENDQRHGPGSYTFKLTGVKKEGTWTNGNLTGKATLIANDHEISLNFESNNKPLSPAQISFPYGYNVAWTDQATIARLVPSVSDVL